MATLANDIKTARTTVGEFLTNPTDEISLNKQIQELSEALFDLDNRNPKDQDLCLKARAKLETHSVQIDTLVFKLCISSLGLDKNIQTEKQKQLAQLQACFPEITNKHTLKTQLLLLERFIPPCDLSTYDGAKIEALLQLVPVLCLWGDKTAIPNYSFAEIPTATLVKLTKEVVKINPRMGMLVRELLRTNNEKEAVTFLRALALIFKLDSSPYSIDRYLPLLESDTEEKMTQMEILLVKITDPTTNSIDERDMMFMQYLLKYIASAPLSLVKEMVEKVQELSTDATGYSATIQMEVLRHPSIEDIIAVCDFFKKIAKPTDTEHEKLDLISMIGRSPEMLPLMSIGIECLKTNTALKELFNSTHYPAQLTTLSSISFVSPQYRLELCQITIDQFNFPPVARMEDAPAPPIICLMREHQDDILAHLDLLLDDTNQTIVIGAISILSLIQDMTSIPETNPTMQKSILRTAVLEQDNLSNPYTVYKRCLDSYKRDVKLPLNSVGGFAFDFPEVGKKAAVALDSAPYTFSELETFRVSNGTRINDKSLELLFNQFEAQFNGDNTNRDAVVVENLGTGAGVAFNELKGKLCGANAYTRKLLQLSDNPMTPAPKALQQWVSVIKYCLESDDPNMIVRIAGSIHNCPAGQGEAIDTIYSTMLPQSARLETSTTLTTPESKALDDLNITFQDMINTFLSQNPSLYQALTEVDSGIHSQYVHVALYLKNLIGRRLGLHHKLVLDHSTGVIGENLLAIDMEKVLTEAVKLLTPKFLAKGLQQAFNRRLRQMDLPRRGESEKEYDIRSTEGDIAFNTVSTLGVKKEVGLPSLEFPSGEVFWAYEVQSHIDTHKNAIQELTDLVKRFEDPASNELSALDEFENILDRFEVANKALVGSAVVSAQLRELASKRTTFPELKAKLAELASNTALYDMALEESAEILEAVEKPCTYLSEEGAKQLLIKGGYLTKTGLEHTSTDEMTGILLY